MYCACSSALLCIKNPMCKFMVFGHASPPPPKISVHVAPNQLINLFVCKIEIKEWFHPTYHCYEIHSSGQPNLQVINCLKLKHLLLLEVKIAFSLPIIDQERRQTVSSVKGYCISGAICTMYTNNKMKKLGEPILRLQHDLIDQSASFSAN